MSLQELHTTLLGAPQTSQICKKTGPEIKDIVEILGTKEIIKRINELRIALEKREIKEEID